MRLMTAKVQRVLGWLLVLLVGCTPTPPVPTPTPLPPTATPPPLRADLISPAPGAADAPVFGPVRLRVAGGPDQQTIANALAFDPPVKGQTAWEADTLLFRPDWPGLAPGADYTVSLKTGPNPPSFRFSTAGKLAVASVVPENGASDVALDATLYVQFSRPVSALASLTAAPNLLHIDPPAAGAGRWLNTSLYTFKPAAPWRPATAYSVTVPPEVSGVAGGRMGDGHTWRFTTLAPGVAATEPKADARLIAPTTPITVAFNQAVDQMAAEARFRLAPPAGAAVPGRATWPDDHTLVFQPASPLADETAYEARVGAGIPAAGGAASTAADTAWQFTTAPAPRVLRIVPPGTGAGGRSGQLEFFFSSPMDRDDVRQKLTVEPKPDNPPFLGWSDDDTHLTLYGAFPPSTQQRVTLPADTRDRFGRPLGQPATAAYTTPAARPQAWLVSPGMVGTYDAAGKPQALLRTTNVSQVSLTLETFDAATFLDLLAKPRPLGDNAAVGTVVRRWTADAAGEANVAKLTPVDLLTGNGRRLDPGFYRLTADPRETGAGRQRTLFVVSRSTLTVKQSDTGALVWAVDTATGQPIAGLPLRLYAGSRGEVASGTTDATGRLSVALPSTSNRADAGQAIVVIGERAGDIAVGASNWDAGISAWEFGLSMAWNTLPWTAYLYTDRPIYRPGQTVHAKGIVRADDDGSYSMPPAGFAPTWQVLDSQGREVATGPASLSDMGTFTADVDLGSEAPTGDYSLLLKLDDRNLGSGRFQVAAYRRPEFDVRLAPDQPAVIAGTAIGATAQADYYFGRPLSGGAVRWRVTADPYRFTSTAEPGYQFGDWEQPEDDAAGNLPPSPRAEGKGTVGPDGSFRFSVPTDLSRDRTSQRFTIEATVTDVNDQEVSARLPVVVHRAGVYVGLKPAGYVARAGEAGPVAVVALDTEGKPVANQAIHVQVARRTWLNARERDADGELRWRSKPEDTPAGDFDLTTDASGHASFSFTPSEAGEFRFIAEAPDAAGHTARTVTSVWAAGAGFTPWRMENTDRLALQADRAEYTPGETAHVLVPAPVADALALVTVERGHILTSRVEQLTGNSPVLDIPLGPETVPNVYVSVTLFKGGNAPTFRAGYLNLAVSAADRKLTVQAQPDRRQYAPRDTATFALTTLDNAGRGVPAEVSVALVDAAVLALSGDRAGDPVAAFWRQRGLGVRTGAGEAVSIDRLNDSITSGRKGGGGDDDTATRREFLDTAFWAPSVRTDASGHASVAIPLPDNVTTWRLLALAVTADTRLGQASSDVVAAKPLLLRPVTPRFLVAGDEATVGAVIANNGDRPLTVRAALTAQTVTAADAAPRTVDVPAGGQVRVDWPVQAGPVSGDGATATLRFEATTDGGPADAVELKLPVVPWGGAVSVATAGEVNGTASEVIDLPYYAVPDRGALTISVAPSLAAALRYSLHYVEEFPYECLEQTVSRFLPRLALDSAINRQGLGDPLGLKAQLPDLVNRSLQRIYQYQHADGGWGWWQNDASQPYLTAYTLHGLIEARDAGYQINSGAVERSVRYLKDWLNADPGAFGVSARAYVLYALTRAGAADDARAAALYDRRADLDLWAKAYLAQTLALRAPQDPRLGGLLSELTDAASTSATGAHWDDKQPDPWSLRTGTATTATILDTLIRLRPDHPLVASAIRWLMAARQDGHWESTHETALSLLALTDYLGASGELKGNFDWTLSVDGRPANQGSASDATRADTTQTTVARRDLQAGENRIELGQQPAGSGRLYYTVQLRYFTPATEIPAQSSGLTVARDYLPAEGDDTPLDAVRVGDLVRVRVTVIAPADLHHVIVEDPLPAGLEALDPNLKITTGVAREVQSAAAKGAGRDWWRWARWNYVDRRDQQVTLFASYLPQGTYQYTYLARASVGGTFRVRPTSAYEQYFPEVFGRADGRALRIDPAK